MRKHHKVKTNRRDTLSDVRRENLRLLAAQWGGPTVLAKKLQYSGPSYVAQLTHGTRPITEKTARGIEATLDLPVNWLDHPHQAPSEDADLLAASVAAVLAELTQKGITPAGDRQVSEAIMLVYEDAQHAGAPRADYVARIVRLIAADARKP